MRAESPAGTAVLPWVLVATGAALFISEFGGALGGLQTLLLVAIAAATLVFVVLHADPAWVISAGIAASMFSGHWSELGFTTWVVPDRVLMIAGSLAVLLRLGPSRSRPPLQLRFVHLVLLAAVGYVFVSMLAVGTTGNRSAVFGLIDQFGIVPFLAFTIAPIVFRTAAQRSILLGTLVATGAYLSLTALFEKLKLTALIVPDYISNPYVGLHYGRSRGPFAEAVADGLALYACAVTAAIAFVVWRREREKLLAAGVALLCLVGVQLTVTRAVWLGAIVATAVVLVVARPLRRFAVPAAALGLVLVLGAFAAIPGLASQARKRQKDQTPIWERRNSNAAALRMIAARPMVGVGWYRHNESAEPFFRNNPNFMLSGERAGMHNLFLTYAVDLGLIGFGFWVLAVALAFGGAMRGRAPPGLLPWRIGLGAIVTCYIVSGIAGPLEYVYPTLLAWTWAGVAYGHRSEGALRLPGLARRRRVHDLQGAPREVA